MQVVVDSNVLISAILRSGETRRLLISRRFDFFCPDFARTEVEKHRIELIRKAKLSEQDFALVVDLVFRCVITIPFEEYVSFKPLALTAGQPDESDWPFLALALKMNCPVWTNDAHFRKQSTVPIFSTTELLRLE
ncbi:MAG: PIN domain-containing protein [Candidatus Micrarchaeota archaeon]